MPDPNEKRLSPSEAEAVKELLQGDGADRRAHGASTIGDIAESLGVSVEDVQAHLRQLRAEKAVAGPTAPRSFRIPVWTAVGLAVVALAIAAWRIGSPAIEEARTNAAVDSYLKRQSSKPHMIRGVLVKDLDPNIAPAPAGMEMILTNGRFALRSVASKDALPLYDSTAEQQLEHLTAVMLDEAAKEPKLAGDGTPMNVAFELETAYSSEGLSRSRGRLLVRPKPGQSHEKFLQERAKAIRFQLRGEVSRLRARTRDALDTSAALPSYAVSAPPGFGVMVKNPSAKTATTVATMTVTPIYLLPIAEMDIRDRMILHLKREIERASEPPPSMPMATGEARPFEPPVSVHVTIKGPVSLLEFDVPTAPGNQYPTAADVAKAQEALIAEKAAEAARQINVLNERASKQ